jgi:RNA polymerase sigma-70 factor (ECF subfamily)
MAISRADLDALRRRDPDALDALTLAHSRRLYRAARGMGFDASDAEDLLQDVFVTFLSSLDRFEGRSALSTWLFGILLRKAQERRRARASEDRHDPIDEEWAAHFDATGRWVRPPAAPDRALTSRQMAAAIETCLDDLPAQQREVSGGVARSAVYAPAAGPASAAGAASSAVRKARRASRVMKRVTTAVAPRPAQ